MQTRERAHCDHSVFPFIKKNKIKCSYAILTPAVKEGNVYLSLEECVNAKKRSLGQYLKMKEDEWLSAWEEGLIKEDEDPKVIQGGKH